jgi:hypothetical protein
MKPEALASESGAAIWERAIEFPGGLSPGTARALLQIQFSEQAHARMKELSAKARAGSLSVQEQADLDTFEPLGCLLDIVHSRARCALKK